MHLKYLFLHRDRDKIERDFDLTQLGGRVPEEDDHVILPNPDADEDSPVTVYHVDEVLHILPVGDMPYHIHVVCMEIVEGDHDDDEPWEQHFMPIGDN